MTAPVTLFPSLADSARLAAATPEGATDLAVVDGSTRWTWRDLDARADAVTGALAHAGVEAGDRVALLAAPSAAAIAALHGIARLGAVAAPLPTSLTAAELAVAADVVKPRTVVAGPGFDAAVAAAGRPVLALDDLVDTASLAAPGSAAVDPSAPAVVVLTSGTTARPKAVVLSTSALVASAGAWLAALPVATGWLLALGLGHVAGLGVVWRAALTGVPLVILARPDAAAIAATLREEPAVSHLSLVPAVLLRLLEVTAGTTPPSTLRAVLLGGGEIPPMLVARALDAGWPVVPTYGLSEAGSGVTALPTVEAAGFPGSAGRALPGVALRVADSDDADVGEIQVRSRTLFDGYLDDPAATARARTGDGWLRTGDLGRLDADGRLFVLDRRTDRIVRGGENISPAEVEAALLEHPDVADAAVVARRDAVFGQVPVAAIVLREGSTDPADDDLAVFLGPRLSRFKRPAAYIRLAALPRTPGGKLQRAGIRAMVDPVDEAPRKHRLERPGGVTIAYRSIGNGQTHMLLLHGTLSTAGQLSGLARLLAAPGDLTVHAIDRRGSGDSRLADATPLDIESHIDDLAAVLDAEEVRAAAVVGVSYGGIVALEFAARRPDRALAAVAYEPPYGPLADERTQAIFAAVASTTERAFETGGSAAAAEAFMRGVAGRDGWDRLPDRARAFLASEGGSAHVDAGLRGLDPDGLAGIRVPTTILTGDASEPFYRPIADALAGRISGARRVHLPGMAHASPITEPASIAAAIRSGLAVAGLVPSDPDPSAAEEPTR